MPLVEPLRHVTGVDELTPDEAAGMGPLLTRASVAVRARASAVVRACVEDCEQAYVCRADEQPDPAAVEAFCRRAQALLGG